MSEISYGAVDLGKCLNPCNYNGLERRCKLEIYEYTDAQKEEVLAKSRKVLKSYRQLRGRAKRLFPHIKSPSFSDMPRGGQSEPDSRLYKYLEVNSAVDNIELCVSNCDLREKLLLQRKYMDSKICQQWELARMSGYSETQYKVYMRSALFQFAEGYGLYPDS